MKFYKKNIYWVEQIGYVFVKLILMLNYNLKKGINIFYGKLFILYGIVYCKFYNKFVEIILMMCNMYI